jgi:hypothetical protein
MCQPSFPCYKILALLFSKLQDQGEQALLGYCGIPTLFTVIEYRYPFAVR